MKLELQEDSFAKLNAKIQDLQNKACAGIVDPARALDMLRDIRIGLFGMAQLMKTEVVLANESVGIGERVGA